MTPCECCDHPLEHAIARALNAHVNNVAPVLIWRELRETLLEWKAEQRVGRGFSGPAGEGEPK